MPEDLNKGFSSKEVKINANSGETEVKNVEEPIAGIKTRENISEKALSEKGEFVENRVWTSLSEE